MKAERHIRRATWNHSRRCSHFFPNQTPTTPRNPSSPSDRILTSVSCPRPQRRRMACTRLFAYGSKSSTTANASPPSCEVSTRSVRISNRCLWPGRVCPALTNAPSIPTHSLSRVRGQHGGDRFPRGSLLQCVYRQLALGCLSWHNLDRRFPATAPPGAQRPDSFILIKETRKLTMEDPI